MLGQNTLFLSTFILPATDPQLKQFYKYFWHADFSLSKPENKSLNLLLNMRVIAFHTIACILTGHSAKALHKYVLLFNLAGYKHSFFSL